MKFATIFAALVSVVPAAYALTVNTPANVVECQPTMFTWSGGQEPYYLTLIPGGQSTAAAIKSFPTQTGTSYTWNVDLQANTLFTIALKDSTGATAYSDIVTIEPGSITCVNTSVDEGGASTGTATGATTAGGATSAAASASGTTSKASGTSSGSASTATSSGAASSLFVSSAMGVAGVMGLLGAALF
ncbi:hypothetical protein AZE42_05302 [Rhizopogon vesiculosus]|uniref:Uncharacterized protein n=1 Tax=Rhizopogon vesiculosus TaxID=180088 RepID=A0A1J8Q946_9AGAM|nr:hypothetical protein AZE42_05302 [Rhizopogon vesiculosus]